MPTCTQGDQAQSRPRSAQLRADLLPVKSLAITRVLPHRKVAKPWAFTSCHGPRVESYRRPLNLQPQEKSDPDLKEKQEGALHTSVQGRAKEEESS